MIGMDHEYAQLRLADPELFENIVAFASTFGKPHEPIDIKTRYQVERYCIGLAIKVRGPA